MTDDRTWSTLHSERDETGVWDSEPGKGRDPYVAGLGKAMLPAIVTAGFAKLAPRYCSTPHAQVHATLPTAPWPILPG